MAIRNGALRQSPEGFFYDERRNVIINAQKQESYCPTGTASRHYEAQVVYADGKQETYPIEKWDDFMRLTSFSVSGWGPIQAVMLFRDGIPRGFVEGPRMFNRGGIRGQS